MEENKILTIAEKIYNHCIDMDFADYEDAKTEDIKNLMHDIELLKKCGNGALLNAIEILIN